MWYSSTVLVWYRTRDKRGNDEATVFIQNAFSLDSTFVYTTSSEDDPNCNIKKCIDYHLDSSFFTFFMVNL